jgi:DNA-binding CsgD family transcriptional regulator
LAAWPGSPVSQMALSTLPVGPPLSIMLSAVPAQSISWTSGDPTWVVLVFDPNRKIHVSAELIARDLHITDGEAGLVAAIVTGYNLQEAALHLGVSEHTARSQLKSVFRKTDIRSQADLIRRVVLGVGSSALRC